MSRRFAADTSVSTDRSIAEIRATVRRYGASDFAHMEADDRAAIAFTMRGRRIQFALEMPNPKDRAFTHTEAKRQARTAAGAREAWEQACRSRWRALALVIKAKLEAVEIGIVVFEDEFLANTIMPGASITFGAAVRSKMELAHREGSHAPLIPYLGGAGEAA